jgi:hypothetical protein
MRRLARLTSPLFPIRIFALAVLTLLLSACVTMTTAPDPLKAEREADASMVVVSVTTNTAQIKGFDGLAVRRTNAPDVNVVEMHALNQIVPDLARDTSVFVGMLREGEYEVAEFSDSKTNRKLDLKTRNRDLIGRFKVTAGKAVDLGRLILTPVNQLVVMGRSAKVTSNKPLLEKYAPDYASLLQGETSEGWLEPRSAQDTVEEYALGRPVGFGPPTELGDGTVLAASRLGTVLVRLTSGKWRAIRGDGLETLFYATPVKQDDTRLIAVGELGTILRLPVGGRKLVPVDAGNLPPGNLLFIDGDAVHGWYVAQQHGSEVTLYHSLELERGDWQPVRKETVGTNFWSGSDQIWFWQRAGGLGYALSNGTINQLDFASGEWRTFKAPNDANLINIVSNPDGSLGILTSPGGGLAGLFSDLYLSKDDGATWREIKPKFKIKGSPPIQLTPHALLAVSRESAFSGHHELHLSHDDGVTWEKCDYRLGERLVALKSGRLLSVDPGMNGIFSISSSDDAGKYWQVEYSNFNRALYDAQHKKQ